MKKKILFLIPNLAHGGAERVLVNLVNNLDRSKYDITVQTLFDTGVNRKYLASDIRYVGGLKKQFRRNNTFMKLFSPEFLWKHIVKEHYDIVVSYLEGPTSRILSGCTDSNTKRVAWIHIELGTPQKAAVGFRSTKEAEKAYNSFDRIIVVSEQVKKCFCQNLNIKTPVSVLYNTNETEQIREKSHQLPDDPVFVTGEIPAVCSVAKLMATKGFDRLLNVHKRLLDEGHRHNVYILGIGEEEKTLRQKIHAYGVQDTFHLLGFKDNPYQYVARCYLYVCSSRREGFSTAVTEALVVGTPVVSTDCSGAKELLGENNEYGIVVENSEEGIYEGMKKMLSDSETLLYYKNKAIERGYYFSKEKTVRAVEEMLDNL
ncbi:MAG: glycosyltransferase [Clostridia bacterium]|nr:glycosyltransferase [Clostridia bacterium]